VARIHRITIQKGLNDRDNHDGVITHLESDILQCEVKWSLGNMSMNKISGSEGEINQEYGINCYTLYKIEKEQRFTVYHRELYSIPYNNLSCKKSKNSIHNWPILMYISN